MKLYGEKAQRDQDAEVEKASQGKNDVPLVDEGDDIDAPLGSKEPAKPRSKEEALLHRAAEEMFMICGSDGERMVQLPGDDNPISNTAMAVGYHLQKRNFYLMNDTVVAVNENKFVRVKADAFRTLAEDYCTFFKWGEDEDYIKRSLSRDDAAAILVSNKFMDWLPKIRSVNRVRLPVLRADNRIELLPTGYDQSSQILTLNPEPEYSLDMVLEDAVRVFYDLYEEFKFSDNNRSVSVVVAAMVGLYGAAMLPPGCLKPCFVVVANAEGAGKTQCVKCIIYPVLGASPVGIKADRDEEVEKRITAIIREGGQILFLDNCKGYFSSPALEAFLSSEVWKGRLLGSTTSIIGLNLATVFITGNGLTVSPDMRRRSLFIELVLDVERAEERQFKRILDDRGLEAMRPKVLAALWALVQNWDLKGRPKASKRNSAFPVWADMVGGIVEAAGFMGCFDVTNIVAALDTDGEDMRRLTANMAPKNEYTFAEIVGLAVEHGCFERLVGAPSLNEEKFDLECKLKPSQTSKLGWLFGRYHGRQIGSVRFVITGKGHSKRFRVLPQPDGNNSGVAPI